MAEWSDTGFANHIVVLDRAGNAPKFPGFTYRRIGPFRRWDSSAQRAALESICRAEQADLFISTYYSLPVETPSLLYVYDMIPEVMGFDLGEPVWREKRRAIEHADSYIAISQNTARDLCRFYPETRSRSLQVAHNAADKLFTPASEAEIAELRSELELRGDYFLFIGTRDVGYKNASLVFEALGRRGDPCPALLLVGGAAELEARFQAQAGNATVRRAALSDEQLRVAYSGALGLLYPSRYEGFGIPILEAMACGCPVVTCRNSSIPEVADDAVIYIAEDSAPELVAAMERLRDPALRDAYRAKGFARVRRFSWEQTAADVERFVLEVIAGRPPGG